MKPRRRLTWKGWTLLAGLAGVLLGMGWMTVGGYRADRLQAALDRDDPGWRLDDMLAARERELPPADRNAVALAVRCQPLLVADFLPWRLRADEWDRPPVSNERPGRLPLADARCTLAECEPALAVARSIGRCDRPGGVSVPPPADVLAARFPHMQAVGQTAELLADAAAVAACDGDGARAVTDAAALVRLARGAANEPRFLGSAAATDVLRRAVRAAEQALALSEPAAGLAELQADFLAEADAPRLATRVRQLRAAYDARLGQIRSGRLTADELASAYGLTNTTVSGLLARVAGADHAMLLRTSTEALALAEQPPHLRPPPESAFAGVPDGLHWFTRELALRVRWMDEWDRLTVARLRAAAVGLACERFRLTTGRWPNTLAELGDLLPAVPIDPYSGRPLVYRRMPGGAVVYALGPDDTDNGGSVALPPSVGRLGFRLFDPDRRNRPAEGDEP